MAPHVESQLHGLGAMLDVWQDRVDHLRTMVARSDVSSRGHYDQMIRRMQVMLADAQERLDEAGVMSPEQWTDARTEVLATVQALQQTYNAVLADWPQE